MPPGPPDSKPPRRGTRAPSLADTLDEADERAQAAAAVIERDVREGLAAEQPVLSTPRARTPAEVELRKTIDELRRLTEWWVCNAASGNLTGANGTTLTAGGGSIRPCRSSTLATTTGRTWQPA